MRTRSRSRRLADLPPVAGAGGLGPHPVSEGMMTRRRQRLLGPADLPFAGSGHPKKRQRLGLRSCTAARTPGRARPSLALAACQLHSSTVGERPTATGHQEVTEWRDWANMTTDLIEEIAVRLLSFNVSEYIRFRTVCKPWRVFTEDPRKRGGLDPRFRPHNWFPLFKTGPRWRICNVFQKIRFRLDLQIFSTSHLLSVATGLLVMCDKATNVVRLLHPLAGTFAEFPDITDVRPYVGAQLNARLAMDDFKACFPGLGSEPNAYLATDIPELGFPAMDVVIDIAYIDDSTSPPTLQLFVKNGSWLVICAKPGDGHWVPLDPCKLSDDALYLFRNSSTYPE